MHPLFLCTLYSYSYMVHATNRYNATMPWNALATSCEPYDKVHQPVLPKQILKNDSWILILPMQIVFLMLFAVCFLPMIQLQ
jgi:hypothetical protein